jgi:serine/threonine-protein kinase RsbT
VANEVTVSITSDADVVSARQAGRALATQVGFAGTDLTVIATAISELARNIVVYAKVGEISLKTLIEGSRHGLEVIARDRGPGITEIGQAMQDGYSTGNSLGLGLPGAKRLMDEFEINSRKGKGTTVRAIKWLR